MNSLCLTVMLTGLCVFTSYAAKAQANNTPAQQSIDTIKPQQPKPAPLFNFSFLNFPKDSVIREQKEISYSSELVRLSKLIDSRTALGQSLINDFGYYKKRKN